MFSEPDVSAIVPSNDPHSGTAFPPRGPRGEFPRFPGTARCSDSLPPSGRASSPSRGRTALGSLVAPRRGEPACLGPGLGHPGAHRDHDAERTGPPRFLGVPDARMPRSWTPVESPRLALIHDAAMRSSAVVTASTSTVLNSRGSLTQPARSLCTLRSVGYPITTQHSVPAGGQPLPGGAGSPLGPVERFPRSRLHLFPLSQALPGALGGITGGSVAPRWRRSVTE